MKEVVNNSNKYKLKLYICGRKFMIGPVLTYQRLYFLVIYQNFGANFCAPKSGYWSQKRMDVEDTEIGIFWLHCAT